MVLSHRLGLKHDNFKKAVSVYMKEESLSYTMEMFTGVSCITNVIHLDCIQKLHLLQSHFSYSF